MTDRNKLLAMQLALVLGVCYFFFFFGLGAFGLTGADEPRYAQIAREMLARHDWIVPTLNGSPWLEKPALLFWKMMNSYSIFGVSDWAARIPAACPCHRGCGRDIFLHAAFPLCQRTGCGNDRRVFCRDDRLWPRRFD